MRMWKIVFFTVLLALSLPADDRDQKIELMEQQIKALQEAVHELKAERSQSEMDEELGFIDERLMEVEKQSFLDRVQMGVEFKTRVDNYDNKMASGKSYSDSYIWSTKFHLNPRADIADNMVFKGRLTTYKNWGDSTRRDTEAIDFYQSRIPGDASVYLERGYIDWGIITGEVPVTLSIGRLPAGDGPSWHFMENTKRQSNYSASLIDAALDGAILTVGLEKTTDIPQAAFRLVYGKPYQEDENDPLGLTYSGVKGSQLDDYHTYGIVLEGSIPSLADSLIGINLLAGQDVINNSLELDASQNGSMGDFYLMGGFVELPQILPGLDLFAHLNYSRMMPDSATYAYGDYQLGMLKGSVLDQSQSLYAVNQAMETGNADQVAALSAQHQALLDSYKQDTDSRSGHNIWLGMRYSLPFEHQPKIGLEYNYGSKYWWSGTVSPYHPTAKMSTRGHAVEAYFLHPLNAYSSLRLGYLYIDNEYSNGLYGEPLKLDALKESAFAQASGLADRYVDSLTNIYLQLSLMF